MTDHLRSEWIADALTERDDEAAYEAIRNEDLGLERGTVSTAAMIATYAADRMAVERAYRSSHFGWWNDYRGAP